MNAPRTDLKKTGFIAATVLAAIGYLLTPQHLSSQLVCCSGIPPVGCECGWYCSGAGQKWECASCTPVLIDVTGNGFSLTNAANGVWFDLSGRGTPRKMAWTSPASDDGFLAMDRNGNGLIDNGFELFGSVTPQPITRSPNGFLALGLLDMPDLGGNNDGVIDALDASFTKLRIWVDRNHDGTSAPNELLTMNDADILRLRFDYQTLRREDEYGNKFRYRARIIGSRDSDIGRWAYDVIFVTDPNQNALSSRPPSDMWVTAQGEAAKALERFKCQSRCGSEK